MGSSSNASGRVSARTYWLRRVAVVGAFTVVAVSVGSLLWARQAPVTARATPTFVVKTPTPSVSASTSSTGPATPTPTTPPPPVACDPASLTLTLAGPRPVKIGTPQVVTAAVVNSGSSACILTLDQSTYELTIMSGNDRIWSTADCADWAPKVSKTLAPQAAHEWQVSWTTQRSASGCQLTSDLRAGTYVATAQMAGSQPAGLAMDLKR